jgi:SAM-dependent methyltransferase
VSAPSKLAPSEIFAEVVETYESLEPPGTDRWNPLTRERELIHRLVLYEQLCRALREAPAPAPTLRVCDLGCGNGRSTRVYLDFGVPPAQLTGLDLRAAAIAEAQASHPGIGFAVTDGDRLPLADGAVDWVALCTVMSSVGPEGRAHLAKEVERVLAPGGCVFWWDRDTAHGFAEGANVDPSVQFPGWTQRYHEHVVVYGRIERLLPEGRVGGLLARALRRLGPAPTHTAALLQKPA